MGLKRVRMVVVTVACATALAVVSGCSSAGAGSGATGSTDAAPGSDANLVGVLASTSTPDDSRKAADARLVAARGKSDDTRLSVLEQILFAPGHSDDMRIYAMDQFADADAARAGKALTLYLSRMDGEVLQHACALAVKLGDTRVLDSLVVSTTRALDAGTPLQNRPEIAAIETLSGKKFDDVLLEDVQRSPKESVRVAALDLLVMRLGEEPMRRKLAVLTPGDDSWLVDLQKFTATFGEIPHGENEVTWARQLRHPQNAGLLQAAIKRHEALKHEADYVFAPRFVGILATCDDVSVAMTRAELLADLKHRLAAQEHIKREVAYAGSPEDVDESLDANEKKLTRCDLLAMRMILLSLEDAGLVAEFQRQGMEDLADTSTEHGGLLAVKDGKVVPRLYPSMYADNDFDYVTSDKLLRDTVTGVAQYHFHFQQVHNEVRAGPGANDLSYVKRARCNAVVITSVGTRRMDVDYYTPSGAVVDLGVVESK